MQNNKPTINKIEQLNIETSGVCDLKCPMCPQSVGREKDFLVMSDLELIKSAIDQAIPLGLKYVNFGGGGEPLLFKQLGEVISYLKERNINTLIYTNGTQLTPEYFEKLCISGLTICKVSCHGWDRESFSRWMSKDYFDQIRNSLIDCKKILDNNNYDTTLQTHHLINDIDNVDFQLEMYRKNWVDYTGLETEIWLMHNWGGLVDKKTENLLSDKYNVPRWEIYKTRTKRSCGRPLANTVELRAGGVDGKKGAVVPCNIVMGHDSKAVMGHLSETPLMDIMNGEIFQNFRDIHLKRDFDELDVCKDCDQLIDAEEILIWTNIEGRNYGESRVSKIEYLEAEKNYQ